MRIENCLESGSFPFVINNFRDKLNTDSTAQMPLRTTKAQTPSKPAPILARAPPMALIARDAVVSPGSQAVCDPAKANNKNDTPTPLIIVPVLSPMAVMDWACSSRCRPARLRTRERESVGEGEEETILQEEKRKRGRKEKDKGTDKGSDRGTRGRRAGRAGRAGETKGWKMLRNRYPVQRRKCNI